MTRTFDRRLRKLEARIGFAQELRRMSDEELEASIDCDKPGMVGVLSQGGDQEQALARMLEGRRAADLKTHELDHIVQVLTDASFLEAQKEVRVTRQAVQFGDHHDGVMEAAEGQGLGKARTVVTLAATSTNSAISFHLPP